LNLKNVLLLHKKTTYQIQAEEYKDERFLKLLADDHESIKRVRIAHDEHLATIEVLEKELEKRGIKFKSIARSDLHGTVTDVDLMISVGGDGTFLDASHFVDSVPLLGVNSSSSSSFGHFCRANKDLFAAVIDRIIDGSLAPEKILRLELVLNGTVVPEKVLNEVLVAHSNPAATSRYFIEINGHKEEQRSSGMWISTPAGSTGSLRSAGGVVQRIVDNRYQFRVREACIRPGENWKHVAGFVDREDAMTIVSLMRTGTLFIDGAHIMHHFALGDEVIVRASKHDLIAFVDPDVNNIFDEIAPAQVCD
jgi:NAD+ kinase